MHEWIHKWMCNYEVINTEQIKSPNSDAAPLTNRLEGGKTSSVQTQSSPRLTSQDNKLRKNRKENPNEIKSKTWCVCLKDRREWTERQVRKSVARRAEALLFSCQQPVSELSEMTEHHAPCFSALFTDLLKPVTATVHCWRNVITNLCSKAT